MPKMIRSGGEPQVLMAVNVDAFRDAEGELFGLVGLINDQGVMTEYLVSKVGAETLMRSLTNFIDASDGRPPT